MSKKSDEEKGSGGFEKLECLGEKRNGNVNFSSETEMGDCEIERSRENERVFVGRKANVINGLERTEKKEVLVDEYASVSEDFKDLRLEKSVEEKDYGYVDKHGQLSEHWMDQWTRGTNQYMNRNRSESVSSSIGDMSMKLDRFAGSLGSKAGMDRSAVERGRFEGLYGNNGSHAENGRTPLFGYPDEGPSNYEPYYFHGHGKQINSNDHVNVPSGVENLELERAEILRKLDELKEQLSRSYYVADKPREREPVDMTPPYPYGNQVTYNASVQPPAVENQMPRPPYFNYSKRPASLMNHHNSDIPHFYPHQKPVLTKIPEYEDPFQPQMTRKPNLQLPHHQYPHVPPHEYYSGQYRNCNLDPIAPYPHETFFHAPTCSCLSCYNQNWRVPPRVPPTKDPVNSNFYHREDPATFGPQRYAPLQSLDPKLQTRWQSHFDSNSDGVGHPRKLVETHRIGRLYRPIAGGAPFITCHKCFELLKLPRKLRMRDNNQKRLRCGACSTLILIEIENKKLSSSVPGGRKHMSAATDQNSPEVSNDSLVSSGCLNANGNSSCSEDFRTGYHFQLADMEHNSLVEDRRLNLDESEKRWVDSSSPSISSREDENRDSVTAREDASESAEMPFKIAFSPTPPRSPAWQESDSPKHSIRRYGQGNRSKHLEHDNKVFSRSSSRNDSVKDTAEATELDVSFSEYQSHMMSQDSAEISRKDDQFKFSKGSESAFVGFIKKSFRDLSRSNHNGENERPKVFINGQPIPDHLVKRAEKFAGTIRPGDYW